MKSQAYDMRRRRLATIHIAAKELGIPDDDGNKAAGVLSTYRRMLFELTGQTSTRDMRPDQLQSVLRHLERLGWKAPKRHRDPRPVRLGRDALISKIEAQLADTRLAWAYADGIARQMFQVESVRWCKPGQLHKIVAALAYEQEKRALLARVDELLHLLGHDHSAITARPNWERHLPTLRRLVKELELRFAEVDV